MAEITANGLFQAIAGGILDANINYEYQLKDAVVAAHTTVESRATRGATVLLP